MRLFNRIPQLKIQSGFSLIELMISITIGLIIVIAAMSAYLAASQSGKVAEAQARLNEDGQAAIAILTQHIRMAGFNPDQAARALNSRTNPVYGTTSFATSPGSFSLSNFIVRGCDGKFSNITAANSLDSLTCAGSSTLPDSLAINYEADRFNTIPTVAGAPTDCLGNSLTTITANLPTLVGSATSTNAVTYTVADLRFYVGTSTVITSPSLYCKGNGGTSTAQPLVENIEDLQFTFGAVSTATTSTTATAAGYLSAYEVVNEANMAALASDAMRWEKVKTVRICVLVRSEASVAPDLASARYVKCDGTLQTSPPDLRLRRAFFTTVTLRNWQP